MRAILGRRRARLKMGSLSQTHMCLRLDYLLMMSAFNVRRNLTGCKVYLASLKDGGSKGTLVAHTLVVYVTNIFLANSYINS